MLCYVSPSVDLFEPDQRSALALTKATILVGMVKLIVGTASWMRLIRESSYTGSSFCLWKLASPMGNFREARGEASRARGDTPRLNASMIRVLAASATAFDTVRVSV